MPASKDKEAETLQRRTELLRIRRQRPKVAFHDPEILALGYPSANAARKDFYRALEQRRKFFDIEVTAYREEQTEIIEALLEVWIPRAMADDDGDGGDHKAGKMVLDLLERQAKLNGWEAALKTELAGPNGGAVPVAAATLTQIRNLINTAGEPDDEDDEPLLPGDEDEDAGDDAR